VKEIMASFPIVITGHVDHGKSTLIGRLLYDTGSLQEERFSEIEQSSADLGKATEFAFVLDAFEEERSKGITIDTSQIYFHSDKRNYVIIDAPGHKEFIRNMVTGASYAEAALLLVDASEGVREQTLRHIHLLALVGIREVCVVINKMDLVGYSAAVFEGIKGEITGIMATLSLVPVAFVPVSALHGVNIARRSAEIGWYGGPSLLEVIDSLDFRPFSERPFRFPVQDRYDWESEPLIAGRVESGVATRGMEVLLLPGGKTTRIKAIRKFREDDVASAGFGESIVLVLEDAAGVGRGDVCVAGEVLAATELAANVFWFYGDYCAGEPLTIRCATQEVAGSMTLESKFDPAEIEVTIDRPERLEIGEIARVTIRTEKALVADRFAAIPEMGRFVLEKDGIPVGGGIVL
jgi:bifunctional enzyme CysN/CysC/sulfate adenylyltransferase subunit 1